MEDGFNEKNKFVRTLNYIICFLLLAGLYLVSLYNFLLFHSLAEIFSIVVSCAVFLVAWNARRFIDNNYLLLVGISLLFVGGIDSLHMLAYKGMGIFPGQGANQATQLWIAARFLQAFSLLAAPFLFGRKLRFGWICAGYAAVTAILVASVFYWKNFPACFEEGVGLTGFKKTSEYLISGILLASGGLLLARRDKFEKDVLQLLTLSIALMIAAELAFTLYISVYGLSNLVGHFFKILSFLLIYRAIVETGFSKPYGLVFRELKKNEEALLRSKQELELRVQERTAELDRTNQMLREEALERERRLRIETALRQIDEKVLSGAKYLDALDIACDTIVGLGYRMCWIGLAEPDYIIRPVAARGFDRRLLDELTFRWDESPQGNVPAGIAVRTGKTYVCPDIRTASLYEPWRMKAGEIGYRSSATIPLISSEEGTIGILTVFSERVGDFPSEEILRLETFARQCTIAVVNARRLEELREAHQKLTFHVNHMPLAYIVWDTDFRVVEWNPAAERIFGWTAAEALGKHSYEMIVPPEARPHVKGVWAKLLEGEESSYSMNANLRKDGAKITCEWFNAPLRDAEGNISGVLSMIHDVSERSRLEKQLQAVQRMESVGTLAGGIAHDFNNALTGILGFSEMLRLRLSNDPKAISDLDEIARCTERASTLTRQLLTFARRQIIEPFPFSLNAVVTDLLKLIRKVVGEHIEIQTFLGGSLPAIRADQGQIEQVLMNLCLNARDAMPEGGKLLIETEVAELDMDYVKIYPYMRVGRHVVLTVSDTGTGMDETTRERVFEPFFTTKEPGKGTGLGLSMVYGIVKQNNGFIHLYSEPGKGTTFKIYFPAIEATPERKVTPREEPLVGGTETILLAEDEETVRVLAERTLNELGYNVLVAKDGEEACVIFEKHKEKIALAVLDIVMPRKGGKNAFEEMCRSNPKLKVIFMSGYAANAIHDAFVLVSGTPFLPKPFGPRSLGKKVREVLDR